MTPIQHVVFALLMLVAGGLSLPGWLLPLKDGIGRFTCRYLSCGFAFAAFTYALTRDHSWWLKTLDLVAAALIFGRAQHWWRQVELIRKFKRAVAEGRGKTTIL